MRFAVLLALCSTLAFAQAPKPLSITFIDVEGGQATLFVTPAGQSLLIDTGWDAHNNRDASRIVAAAHKAGLTRIDTVLITHFHEDHVGGVPQLAAMIPIGTFIDHGVNRELDHGDVEHFDAEYRKVLSSSHAKHIVPHVGDLLPIPGLHVEVISADGQTLTRPLTGAGQPNSFCAQSQPRPVDQTENARSLGVEITFSKLKILDLGDLTWDKEMQLMCPNNNLGTVDLLIVSHHGWSQSSSPALVDAIRPRVAIMDNGATKGGSLPTLDTVRTIPGLETLWQLHFSEEGGAAHNAAEKYIANIPGTDSAYTLAVAAQPNGSFSVTNGRTAYHQDYPAR
jgi:competence protein ComEC